MQLDRALPPLRISSRQWDYDVLFAPSIRAAIELALADQGEVLVVCDENVAQLHNEALANVLQSHPTYLVAASEDTKSLTGVTELVDWLIDQRAVRSATILAIGGGCIQDLVSFTAHLYYRGINWAFIPTTVLSQSDSCIGAKSGINVLPFKNQLGALHSPRRVAIATEFLSTLPDIELASGYGEIVKLSVTSSHSFLSRLTAALDEGGIRNNDLLELIRASLRAKQEIIEIDEYETDLRRILNYGHSFGHALEAISGHAIPHGLSVLWGIDVINWLGARWGVTDVGIAQQLSALIREHFEYRMPVRPTAPELMAQLNRDKKVSQGVMNFAVLETEGIFCILPRALDQELEDLVSEYLETDYVFLGN